MKLSKENVDILAKVSFLAPKNGGKKEPPQTGYRGQFFYDGIDCDAIHVFDVKGKIPFTSEVDDYIYLLNPDHLGKLREGMPFLIREGPHTVGYGLVIRVKPTEPPTA